MKRYEFKDIGINRHSDDLFIPPEALFIRRNDTWIPIEDLIDGYETLAVSGRELVPYTLNSEDLDGQDGSRLVSANYGAREITVSYRLQAKDDYEYREKFQLLNYYLSQKQFDFYFYDDDQYCFTGTLSGADAPPTARNDVTSTYTITCSSPFKRLKNPTSYTGQDFILIYEPVLYPTVPDSIELTVKSDTNSVDVTNGTYTISLVGAFKTGDTVDIEPDNQRILINGQSRLDTLKLTSDFENFEVQQSDKVSCDAASVIKMKLRRLAL